MSNYTALLQTRLTNPKPNKLIQDTRYLQFLEQNISKNTMGTFLYEALVDKMRLMEGEIELLKQKTSN